MAMKEDGKVRGQKVVGIRHGAVEGVYEFGCDCPINKHKNVQAALNCEKWRKKAKAEGLVVEPDFKY